MKKLTLFLACALFGAAATAQQPAPYDSLRNFLGQDVMRYKGQVLYLLPSNAARANQGYADFAREPDFDLGPNGRNVFRSVDSKTAQNKVSDYSLMAGHYFRVTDIIPRPTKSFTRGATTHYLELMDLTDGETCYVGYEVSTEATFSKFVVVGYYEKMRRMMIGKSFVYTGKEPDANRSKNYLGLQNMDGKGAISNVQAGTEWTCIDVAIEEGNDYQMIGVLENPLYGHAYTMVSDLQNTADKNAKFRSYEDLKADMERAQKKENERLAKLASKRQEAISKFGKENGEIMANGEVKVGMTKEMCRWVFGDPFNVITGTGVEQWYYTNGRYLYFRDGKLTRQTQVANYKDEGQYSHN